VWLWRARFCKTRALAAKRVADGEVTGERQGAAIALDKPSRQIRAGDVLRLAFGERRATIQIQGVGERRGAACEARALYTLLS
jgi:ribosome-associated heat shock protein Hsp15